MIDWDALDVLRKREMCSGGFGSLGTRYVPGEGDNPQAFIIGEAPGAQEEIKGRPFVGPAGAVLRQLMMLAGLHTEAFPNFPDANCWLTNVVKFRPPGNRNPTEAEIKAARPYLREEWIAVGRPRLIIPVGGIALRAITGKQISILRAAGKCHWYAGEYTGKGGPNLAIWPMVHPSFGLRNPGVQPLLEEDWERLGKWRSANA